MSVRVRVVTTTTTPTTGGRLDAVLRAGLDAQPIGSYGACTEEVLELMKMLKKEPSPTDEEFADAFERAALTNECGKFTQLPLQARVWEDVVKKLESKATKRDFPLLKQVLLTYASKK